MMTRMREANRLIMSWKAKRKEIATKKSISEVDVGSEDYHGKQPRSETRREGKLRSPGDDLHGDVIFELAHHL